MSESRRHVINLAEIKETHSFFKSDSRIFVTPLESFATELAAVNWFEKAIKHSRLSGCAIIDRFFMQPQDSEIEIVIAD
jgi:hypothetical protein